VAVEGAEPRELDWQSKRGRVCSYSGKHSSKMPLQLYAPEIVTSLRATEVTASSEGALHVRNGQRRLGQLLQKAGFCCVGMSMIGSHTSREASYSRWRWRWRHPPDALVLFPVQERSQQRLRACLPRRSCVNSCVNHSHVTWRRRARTENTKVRKFHHKLAASPDRYASATMQRISACHAVPHAVLDVDSAAITETETDLRRSLW
jgi:hypothetical protein